MRRIKYVSQFTRPLGAEDLAAIGHVAMENNRRLGLTGILVTSGGLFLQVLEGPESAVDSVFASIRADERHRDVLLLAVEENVAERQFPDWFMPVVDLDAGSEERLEPLRALLETIAADRARLDSLTITLERAIWRELASRA